MPNNKINEKKLTQCFVEVINFDDFARYLCAFRPNPLVTFSHDFNGKRVYSTSLILANTMISLYAPFTKKGRYISYSIKEGKESCNVVDSAKEIARFSPIINLESTNYDLPVDNSLLIDKFHPIQVQDIESLARLTYDPESPDESIMTLYSFQLGKKWIVGYIVSVDFESETYYFYYVEVEKEPEKPFLRYRGIDGKESDFSEKLEHSYPLLPIIRIKNHPIFGFNSK